MSVHSPPRPPCYYQQYDQQQQQHQLEHPIITEEERMNQVRQANDEIARRKQEKRDLDLERNACADNVRRLRELIRERYALDLYIWEKRNVQRASRKMIEPKCIKADAILQDIYFIVNEWNEYLFDEQEWQMVRRIKAGLSTRQQENGESGEPAIWGDLAPWDRREENQTEAPRYRVSLPSSTSGPSTISSATISSGRSWDTGTSEA